MQRPTRQQLLLLLLLSLFSAPQIYAEGFFRWQDAQGRTHYGDTPPDDARSPQVIALDTQQPLYRIKKISDGDTVIVEHLGKVRLLGINTPEIERRDRDAEPLGDEAHRRLKTLLQGKRVYLEFDQRRRDRFKRILAHVTREDGMPINETLLREGLARALFLQPNMKHLQRYYDAEAEAQQARLGLWERSEYRIRPAQQAEQCVHAFCRLRGKVQRVNKTRHYTVLHLPGKLQLAIKNQYLPQFDAAGIKPKNLQGKTITVRGWVSRRKGHPNMKLQHPMQIRLSSK